MNYLDEILAKTKIKTGFLSVRNATWRGLSGISEPFSLTATNLIDQLSINTEWRLKIEKKGHQLYITRYSHDEPTGAIMMLHSSRNYKQMYERIMK